MSDYYRSLAWALVANGGLTDMKLSNIQVVMLYDLVSKEVEKDPTNPEWLSILNRLERMRAYRDKTWGGKDDWVGPTHKQGVWGKDYV